ncbi:MAG: benzoate/H(+) symporter BenE family transporter [Gammaproteobacteria bacterium]|nr:benzoate/H(+) symporter BenE family transporter [Gammaproteobacteria bacterium]
MFGAFPAEFGLALARLALLSTIASSLYTAVADSAAREAAVINFVVTACGVSLFGSGRRNLGAGRDPGILKIKT